MMYDVCIVCNMYDSGRLRPESHVGGLDLTEHNIRLHDLDTRPYANISGPLVSGLDRSHTQGGRSLCRFG